MSVLFVLVAATSGCDEIVEAVACSTENDSFALNTNATLTGASSTAAVVQEVTVRGDKKLPNVTPATVTIGQGDLSVTNGSGSGNVNVLIAVNNIVVAKVSATLTDGAITQFPGTVTIGALDANASAIVNAIAGGAAGLRVAANTSEAQNAVKKAIRSSSFKVQVIGQFSGTAAGTIQLNRATFNLDCD